MPASRWKATAPLAALTLLAGLVGPLVTAPSAEATCPPTYRVVGDYLVGTFSVVGSCTWTPPGDGLGIGYVIVGGGGGGIRGCSHHCRRMPDVRGTGNESPGDSRS